MELLIIHKENKLYLQAELCLREEDLWCKEMEE